MTVESGDEWGAWMRAAQSGDAEAYRRLLTALRPWLLAYVRRRLRGDEAEDIVQMTLLSLHARRHTYDPQSPFMPWIAAVVRHKLIDHVRRAGRRVFVEIDETLAAENDGFDAGLARRDTEVLLARLPSEQARLIRMTKVTGLSVEETAHITGKGTAAVKVAVHRGLRKLKAMVGGADNE
jgi:RNA polymerase sigma-70 factor, ECF subfamily